MVHARTRPVPHPEQVKRNDRPLWLAGVVPEEMNVELAHKLSEHEAGDGRPGRWEELVEIIEVIVLAVVAIATAWSGYQAAKWDGRQAVLYGQSSRDRFAADAASTAGGQTLISNVTLFTAWLQAHETKNVDLQRILRKRMTPEYGVAFDAWLATEPFTNPNAPAGPVAMPQYRNPGYEKAATLNDQASAAFEEGTHARDTAEKYIRDTVLFASVLFLVALAQRLRARAARIGANVIAVGLLVFVLASVSTLERL